MNTEIANKETKKNTIPARSDIYQDKGCIRLTMDMPGVSKDSLNIRIEDNKLIIDGERSLPDVDGKYIVREIRTGNYHQEYTIDETIDRDKVDASIKNGRVTIKLTTKKAEKPRKIKVSAA